MKTLVVEPFHTGSHRAWAEGFAEYSGHDVRLVTHPGRWWKWRMRGSALTLARSLAELDDWKPDLVLVSDMIDLAQFRTFARPYIGDVPTVLYFHESQLTYPSPAGVGADLSYPLINWLSAVAADRVFFNSDYHLRVFFEGLPELLERFPDASHSHLIEEVRNRSEVLPAGVDLSWIDDLRGTGGPPRVLWNHRWEFDKDPDAFADAVEHVDGSGFEFDLVLLGYRPPHVPPALRRVRECAGERIVYDGEAPADTYRKLVSGSDVVVSTARQEFFGISVVEAVAAGCRPVLPNRLSYPWLIPEEYHDMVLYEEGDLVDALVAAIRNPRPPDLLVTSMRSFSWEVIAPQYDRRFQEMAN
jgi:glycosyltransferase involved in cell wall biosynthesis